MQPPNGKPAMSHNPHVEQFGRVTCDAVSYLIEQKTQMADDNSKTAWNRSTRDTRPPLIRPPRVHADTVLLRTAISSSTPAHRALRAASHNARPCDAVYLVQHENCAKRMFITVFLYLFCAPSSGETNETSKMVKVMIYRQFR